MNTQTILIIALLIMTAVVVALSIFIIVLMKKNKGNDQDLQQEIERINNSLGEVSVALEKEIKHSQEVVLSATNSSNVGIVSVIKPYMDNFQTNIDKLNNSTNQKLEQINDGLSKNVDNMRQEISVTLKDNRKELNESVSGMRNELKSNLTEVRQDNSKQLDEMRKTVDEKLSSTLDTRVKSAFEMVSLRLEAVQKGFGEMQQLSDRVTDLNKVFSNVKTRGGWGEVALQSLLEQILSPEQFQCQCQVKEKSQERVDFAICMPDNVLLPIDAKFPLEDYERLVDAKENINKEDIARYSKALKDRIKSFATSISSKYINPPRTTNFAIMYVPTEGLYAEIINDGSLVSDLQAKYNIIVCGPTTITALLNSLQVGFNTLKIQKRSGDIAKLMKAFQADFDKYTALIGKAKQKAQNVVDELDNLNNRNNSIIKKLNKVNGYEEIENSCDEACAQAIEADMEIDNEN